MMRLLEQEERIEVDYNQGVFWVLLKTLQIMSRASSKIEDLFSNADALGLLLSMWTWLYCVHWLQQNVSQAPEHIRVQAKSLGEPVQYCAFLFRR